MKRRLSTVGCAGFSLIEALLVVSILGILLALAFPTYQRVVMERRVQNTAREIAGLLRAAQQLAVAKSAEVASVVVKFQGDEVSVYVRPREGNGDQLVLASGYTAGQLKPVRLGVTVSPQASELSFLPSGEATPAPFTVTVSGGGHTRYVCVNAAGLVRVPASGDCSTGEPQ